MSRRAIAIIVAALVLLLTLGCYWAMTQRVGELLAEDSKARTARAARLVDQGARLEMLQLMRSAEKLSRSPSLVKTVRATGQNERNAAKDAAFREFLSGYEGSGTSSAPDILALVDATGDVIAMHGVAQPIAGQWKSSGEMQYPALGWAISTRLALSEVWDVPGSGLMKVGVASVVDYENSTSTDPVSAPIIGAVVIAHSLTSQDARIRAGGLGAHIAYSDGKKIYATSFVSGNNEDTSKLRQMNPENRGSQIKIGAQPYNQQIVNFPRFSNVQQYPAGYVSHAAELRVLASPDDQGAVLAAAQQLVWILGIGGLVLGLSGMYLTGRRILSQVDEVELGVAEIINGNVDKTFPTVGTELEGLANGLNVMIARLLGKPEPGEEASLSNMSFAMESEAQAPRGPDPELVALASEPEASYFRRLYEEFTSARTAAGTPDSTTFDNFVAKLRVNEAKLKTQYNCKSVRFRVINKDNKVSLKPVPIFD